MKVSRVFLFLVILGGLLGMSTVPPAVAQTTPGPLTLRVTPAFDGYFKNGEWLAAWAEIENTGKNVDAQLSVQIIKSNSQSTYAVSVALPTGARKRVALYLLPNNFSRELEVRLSGPDGPLAQQKITVRPQSNITFLAGLVARERGGLALLNGASFPGQERPKAIVDVSLEDLPERVEGLRSFDLLVFNDVDTSRLSVAQANALGDWVKQGGRLVIGGGGGAGITLAGLPAGLPGAELAGQTELQAADLRGLADFAAGSAIQTGGTFIAARYTPVENSSLLAGDSRLPLVIESNNGDGHVDLVSLNLSSAPFNAWPDTIKFWNQLLAPTAEYPPNLPQDISLRQMGNMEVASNLGNIPALDLPSIQWLSLLLGIYILLVGPVNYLALRRLRRLQLAWATIPVLTLLFSAGAFSIGYWLRGSDVILNQIALITPNGGGAATVSNYLGLFSPSQRSYSIDVLTSGLLSPVTGYDGNPWNPNGQQSGGANVTFVQGDQPRVSGLAIDQWSFQAFSEEQRWAQFGNLRADLRLDNDRIAGTLRNETGLNLTDISVVVGSNFIRLGDLPAGGEKPVEVPLGAPSSSPMGMPISYRLYETVGPMNQSDSRMLDLKRNLASRVLDGANSKFGFMRKEMQSSHGLAPASLAPTATILAWTDQVPPEVRVDGSPVKKQVLGMISQKVDLTLGGAEVVTVPNGMIQGSMTQAPTMGGMCGNGTSTGVVIENGTAEFQYRLPNLSGYRVSELRLNLTGDGPNPAAPGIALYNWSQKSWTVLKDPVLGNNSIAAPEAFIDAKNTVKIQITGKGNNRGFCTFIDLGMKAEKEGAHASR